MRALAADVAAFEKSVVFFEAVVTSENHTNLEFSEWSEEAKITDSRAQELANIGIKIALKFVGFGILVVDFSAGDGGFVGTVFVRHDDVLLSGKIGDEVSGEGEQSTEGSVAVQKALAIEAE